MGHAAGMFYRFLVAADSTVDRFIIRDVDSRLNARDRLAVEEWIQSKLAVHVLRDHVNHCLPMNGRIYSTWSFHLLSSRWDVGRRDGSDSYDENNGRRMG
jgi:hypothetical protein